MNKIIVSIVLTIILILGINRITANTIETIILFILKKLINLVQLSSKIYHDLDEKNEL